MSDILARLQAAHASIHSKDARVCVPVPEYDLTLYFPAVTGADQTAINRGVPRGDDTALMVNFLVRMAEDKGGAKLFSAGPDRMAELKAELHRIPLRILMRIMVEATGKVSADMAAEIAALDTDDLRKALVAGLPEGTALADAIADAPPEAMQAAMTDLARAGSAAGSALRKNA